MIFGHLGLAAAVASGRPGSLDNVRIAILVAAAFAPDILDALFALSDVCNPYGLYSHTLPVVALLAAVAAGAMLLATGVRTDALLVAAVVLLHAPADFVTGRKLFWPGEEFFGLRLYDSPLADFALEAVLVASGWWLLRRRGQAPRWAVSVATLLSVLAMQAIINVSGAQRGMTFKPNACTSASTALPATVH